MHGLSLLLICACDYYYPDSLQREMKTEWKSEFPTFTQEIIE